MALAVVVDGKAMEVSEPRVCRMILALVTRQERIKGISQGDVQIHFAAPDRKLNVRLAEADRE